MRLNSNGTFEADPGEKITFTVTRKNSPCLAGFDPRGWEKCDEETAPDDRTRIKSCTAKKTVSSNSSMTIAVDFKKDEKGAYDPEDEYNVNIKGETGKAVDVPFSPPPVINAETFKFHVSLP
jgi:hypothetical protein